jgi:hypothetical protein
MGFLTFGQESGHLCMGLNSCPLPRWQASGEGIVSYEWGHGQRASLHKIFLPLSA